MGRWRTQLGKWAWTKSVSEVQEAATFGKPAWQDSTTMLLASPAAAIKGFYPFIWPHSILTGQDLGICPSSASRDSPCCSFHSRKQDNNYHQYYTIWRGVGWETPRKWEPSTTDNISVSFPACGAWGVIMSMKAQWKQGYCLLFLCLIIFLHCIIFLFANCTSQVKICWMNKMVFICFLANAIVEKFKKKV